MDSRLIWLALAAFVGGTEGGLIAGLLPAISAEMRITIGQAGQLVIGYSLAYAIGPPLVAVLAGGVGRRRILAGAELGLAVCAGLIAIAPLFEWMVAARTLLAIAAGTFTGTAIATAAMIAPPGKRGQALQIITMGQSLAVLVGVPVSTYVAARLSWRIDYAAIALMAGAAAFALYLKLPRGMQGDTQTIRDRIRVLANPGMAPALISTMLFMTGSTSVMIYIAAVMTGAELGHEVLPLVLLANGIGAVASSISAGTLTDRLGSRSGVIVFSLAVIGVLALYALLPHLPAGLRLPLLFAIMVTQGYVGWAYWIANCSHIAHLAPTSVPVAISVNMAALNIGMALSAAAGGFIVDRWGANVLAFAGAPVVIVALLIWLAVPSRENA